MPVASAWQPGPAAMQGSQAAAAQVVALPLHPRASALAPAEKGTPADAAAACLGQAVHRVLEWAAAQRERPAHGAGPLASWAAAAAAEFGVADAASVQAIAARILSSPQCAPFFDADNLAWSGNEVPLAAVGSGQVLRIDRLVCTAGSEPTWWVLDYKLGAAPQHNPSYCEQLAAYRRAVQALQPGERVRAGFISGAGDLIELA